MPKNTERVQRITSTLQTNELDALICVLPENILMLSGYWPVVGTALCIATRDGTIAVLAPEDEKELAHDGWASEVRTYAPGSLQRLTTPMAEVRDPLHSLLRDLGVAGGRLGQEDSSVFMESSYSAMYNFLLDFMSLLDEISPDTWYLSGDEAIAQLRATLTTHEVDRVRLACRIAGQAFASGQTSLQPGMREPDIAAAFQSPIQSLSLHHDDVQRAGGFVWCMSGPNSALAGAAYARTRNRELQAGDLVLIHCNSYLDGYWTDITRTYCLGAPDERQRSIYDAIFAAREAALTAIRPGARAADVDRAARDVLTGCGFGQYFTHGLGHNVGFSAISADFPPRIHPASPDTLEVGMTFNVEPSIYIHGYGGIRHCDVVTVTEDGVEVLTPFHKDMERLSIGRDAIRQQLRETFTGVQGSMADELIAERREEAVRDQN